MQYPYDQVKTIYAMSAKKGCAVSTLASRIQTLFPLPSEGIPYIDTAIEALPKKIEFGPNKNEKVRNAVYTLAVHYLTVFLLSGDIKRVEAIFAPVNETSYLHTVRTYLLGVTNQDDDSIRNAIHLASYTLMYHLPTIYTQRYTPEETDIVSVRQLVNAVLSVVGDQPLQSSTIDDLIETPTVSNASVDFIAGDTAYIVRTRRTYTRDVFHLLICYVVLKKTPAYRAMNVNRLCMIGSAQGRCRTIDIRRVNPRVLAIVHDCIFGTTEQTVIPGIIG